MGLALKVQNLIIKRNKGKLAIGELRFSVLGVGVQGKRKSCLRFGDVGLRRLRFWGFQIRVRVFGVQF